MYLPDIQQMRLAHVGIRSGSVWRVCDTIYVSARSKTRLSAGESCISKGRDPFHTASCKLRMTAFDAMESAPRQNLQRS